jgi:hypothetical protein
MKFSIFLLSLLTIHSTSAMLNRSISSANINIKEEIKDNLFEYSRSYLDMVKKLAYLDLSKINQIPQKEEKQNKEKSGEK